MPGSTLRLTAVAARLLALTALSLLAASGVASAQTHAKGWDPASFKKPSEVELKRRLTPEQFAVTQEDATEPPYHNVYWDNHEAGIYVDVVSGEPLFSSLDKYDSRTGWPSFTRPLEPANIATHSDRKLLVERTGLGAGLLRDASDGRVEPHARLDAHHEEVEDVRQSVGHCALALPRAEAKPDIGQQESETGENHRDGEQVRQRSLDHDPVEEVGKAQSNPDGTLAAQEDGYRGRVVEPGQDQPLAVAGEEGRVAWCQPAAEPLHQSLPVTGRALLPAKDRDVARRRGKRRGEALGPDGGKKPQEQGTDRERQPRHQHEGHRDDGQRTHGLIP